MWLNRFRSWVEDKRGMAAVEFALIAGPLMIFLLATFEVTLRLQAADEFERYAVSYTHLTLPTNREV